MAWTGQVILDSDKADVGTAVCTWDKGLATEFTFTTRARVNAAGRTAVVAAAKAALVDFQTRATSETSFGVNLTTALNA
jgi:hypothetical protein